MRSRVWTVIGAIVTVLSLALPLTAADVQSGGAALTAAEKEQLNDLLVKQASRVRNLYVTFDMVFKPGEPDAAYSSFEWAFSGEKEYRKRYWTVPLGTPLPKRYGVAIWDGNLLKAYDSELCNGSIRNSHDYHASDDIPSTGSEYRVVLGYANGIDGGQSPFKGQLMDFQAHWISPGKIAEVQEGKLHTRWTIDVDRGGLVTRTAMFLKGNDNAWETEPWLVWTIGDAREVMPGLWMPMKAHSHTKAVLQHAAFDKDIIVKDLRLNDPSTEAKFVWHFPNGALYYDFVNKSSIVAGGAADVLDKEGAVVGARSRFPRAAIMWTAVCLTCVIAVILIAVLIRRRGLPNRAGREDI